MSNTASWPSPDQQHNRAGRNDVVGVYLLDPTTNLATSPGGQAVSSSASLSNVVANASSVSLLVSNISRKGVYVYNDSSSALYLAYAATAATNAFTVKIGPTTLFEMPTNPVYTGAISGIWDTAVGNARITELS